LAKAQGIVGKEAVLADVSAFMQEEIKTWDDLTSQDAQKYIQSLGAPA